ncbi:exopolysaccharide biosynthesis polyprenyl glycosylphosphotransferase [Acidocella sp.]|uniref:exopolysaccharide biosynthesis polyprenyl glycosylphosphotransferase n=1 Tax=Acidocella sp. TaxID=50710 RepID=UPI00262CFD0D|nr:exopolysaccharide biosynthesis polyprenyl glycosylphosphotransferase [Acidocella sp.]
MMDYATTFSDYASRDYARLDTAAQRQELERDHMFPSAVSLRTIVNVSVFIQILALWSIFSASLDLVATRDAWLRCALAGLVLAAMFGLYWRKAGLFTPRWMAEPARRLAPPGVLLNSFCAAVFLSFLFACLENVRPDDALCGALTAGIAVLLLAAGGGIVTRSFLRHAMRRRRLACDIVLAGESVAMGRFIRQMREHHPAVRIRAAFVLAPTAMPGEVEGVMVPGGISDLLSYHAKFPKPHVVVITPADAVMTTEHLDALRMQPLHVLALAEPLLAGDFATRICAHGVPGVKLKPLLEPPLRPLDHLLKSTFDRLAGLMALILFAPVMLGCAVMIMLTSPGPVLYRQKRIGYRNKMFDVYKFRSMHFLHSDKVTLTRRNDDRIFAFGALMRRLSLDELPQLFNVVRGEMSLVGPRPHMREAKAGDDLYYDVVPEYASRHRVKPGITGWAQVNGWRGPTETSEAIHARVAHDLYYIEHWSFWFDVKILFRTIAGGFSGSNAF